MKLPRSSLFARVLENANSKLVLAFIALLATALLLGGQSTTVAAVAIVLWGFA